MKYSRQMSDDMLFATIINDGRIIVKAEICRNDYDDSNHKRFFKSIEINEVCLKKYPIFVSLIREKRVDWDMTLCTMSENGSEYQTIYLKELR